jgi:mono/diheme cytochrome c family protein
MKEEHKLQYKEKYAQAKQKGVKFWPDIIYKDLLVVFALFIIAVMLATFVGVAQEPKADPSDSSYIPRPEWYFLFLFKFLAIYGQIPILGKIEWIAATLVPGIAVGALFLLPFLDRSPYRHFSKRGMALAFMTLLVVTMVGLTLIADIPTDQLSLLQFLAGLGLPLLFLIAVIVIPFIFKQDPNRILTWATGVGSALILGLTVAILLFATPAAATEEVALASTLAEKVVLGEELYGLHCVECHGAEGEGGEVVGVEGMEGAILEAINTRDLMYTFTDDTLYNIINYGQPESDPAMTPFGRAYGGELGPGEMEAIVVFMRYTWDDRAELPAEAVAASAIPVLGPDEVPSYDMHIQPIVKRYCISCHREGKTNNNYWMTSYDEMINTGDNAPNLVAGDMLCNTIRMLNREEIEAGGPMPPTKALKPELLDIFVRWIMAGMPETAEDAAAASGGAPVEAPYPAPVQVPYP